MFLSQRQKKILDIVQKQEPVTGSTIANLLQVSRSALRPDLAVLTMMGYLSAKPKVGYTYKKAAANRIADVLCQHQVKEIQSQAAVVKDNATIYDAIVTMFAKDTGSIFVVDSHNYLAGIISRKDLLKATLGQGAIQQTPVSVIMTRMPNIITVTSADPIMEIVKKIVEHEVDSLPVVKPAADSNGLELFSITGRVTKTSLARFLLDLACS